MLLRILCLATVVGVLSCSEGQSSGLDPNLLISGTPRSDVGTGGIGGDTMTGGTGGGTTGGTGGGTGGSSAVPPVTDVWPGSGCGTPLRDDQAVTIPGQPTGYTQFSVPTTGESVAGSAPEFAQDRYFSVRVPADYDPNTPYRTVYIGQGCGTDNMSGWKNAYKLFNESQGGTEQAIYVAVSLPDEDLKPSPNGRCYDNRAGEESIEWEAFQEIHNFVDANYCVDNNRVFVSGYSTGGWLSNMWGCYFAGVDPGRKFAPGFTIRGQAAVTGGLPLVPECGGPVAAIWIHDQFDPANEIAGNLQARDRVLAVNGCADSATESWGEGMELAQIDCQRYVDCPAEYPVIFCTTTESGHTDQFARAIPAFTQFFELMAP